MATLAADELPTLVGLLASYLRVPTSLARDPATGTVTGTFDPPLTTAEQTLLTDLFTLAKSRVGGLSPTEWDAIQPDVAACRTYLGLATPTAAQSATALKSLIRVVAALLRQ